MNQGKKDRRRIDLQDFEKTLRAIRHHGTAKKTHGARARRRLPSLCRVAASSMRVHWLRIGKRAGSGGRRCS